MNQKPSHKRVANAIFGFTLLLVLSGSSPGHAEEDRPDLERWVPGLSFDSGVRVVETNATVSSLRGDFQGDTRAVFGYIGATAQLASPAWFDIPGSPRFFVRVGAASSFDGEEKIANDGGAGEIVIPIIDNNNDGIADAPTPVTAVEGQGSATEARSEPLIITAGVGVDFEWTVLERKVHIKPSFEWIMQDDRVKSLLGIAESISAVPGECPCRTAFARAENTEPTYGIGPGIEFEAEATRVGSILLSVYVTGQAYYNFDRKVSVSATGEFSDGSGAVFVQSNYERERWDYRAGVGMRLNWLPE